MEKCLFCGRSEEFNRLYKLHQWDKPDKYDWFCEKHIEQIKDFYEVEKRGFLEHFKDPSLREKYLTEGQRALYDRLNKR
jgi:hypothetical protein